MNNPVSNTYNPFKILANNYLDKKLNLCSELEAKVKSVREKIDYTQQDIKDINSAVKKYKIASEISSITGFFLKILSTDRYNDFIQRNQHALDRIKYINKLAGVHSSRINVSDEVGKPIGQTLENDLLSLLCDEHIFERMKKFGHHFAAGQEPKFRMKRIDNFQDLCNQFPLFSVPGNKLQFFEDQKGDGLEIRIRGRFEDGLYKSYSLDNLTKEQIQDIISNYDPSDIAIVHPTKLMNVDELLKCGVLQRDVNTKALFITEGFQYLGNGFEYRPDSGWQHLEPIGLLKRPPNEFRLEVLVHKPKNGGVKAQGHASLRITTPSGEVFSVGFFPDNKKSSPTNEDPSSILGEHEEEAKIQQGALMSPDRFIFLPESAYETEIVAFDLKGKENFHKVMDYIDQLKGGKETPSNLLFQATHHNCAVFAKEVADLAVKNGAVLMTEKPSSYSLKRAGIVFTKFIMNIGINFPGIAKHFKASKDLGTAFENLKVADLFGRTVFLPADLPYALA